MFSGIVEILTAHRISRKQWNPQQANMGEDRRVFHRVPLKIPCRLIHSSFGLESAGTAVNVGLGGTGVIVPVNWSEGSRIRIRLEPLDFDMDAIIVFRREEPPLFHYGVKFQKMDYLKIIKLRRFLQKHHSGRLTL